MRHIPELDGLRGLAASMVVVFHWAPKYTFWGWGFVNCFFVLSGYLIGRIILEAVLDQRFSLRDFYMRRILRIWPVYYLSLIAILVYHLATRGSGFLEGPYFTDWLFSLFYLQFTQYYFMQGVDPALALDFLPGMLPIWTVAAEEQFYLILPLLMLWLVPRMKLNWLIVACLLAALLGPTARLSGFVSILLLTQIDGLMLGVALAAITTRNLRHHGTDGSRGLSLILAAATLIGAAGIAPYIVRGYIVTPGPAELLGSPLLWTWTNLLFFGLIGLIVVNPGNRPSAFLRTRLFAYFGSISYALYVFHMPLLYYVKPHVMALFGPDLHWLGVIATLGVLIGTPHLSKVLVEKPILKFKDRFPNKRPAPT
ncbi:MAG: acyltransferase [Pseudomonadota bacterium]|nr:acyltransferase [Pseudomonadota bacterium]